MNYIYRVYAWLYSGGVEHIANTNDFERAKAMGRNLNKKEYINYLIIQHDIKLNSDFPIYRENIYKGRVLEKK